MSSGVARRGFLVVRDKKAVVAGQLLKKIQRFTGKAQREYGLDALHGLAGDHAPEAERSAPLTLDAPPQKADRGRVFRAEEFDSLLTDDSDKGLQHV